MPIFFVPCQQEYAKEIEMHDTIVNSFQKKCLSRFKAFDLGPFR